MHAPMKRARVFAEAVVIMVCPVLLAITLKKVDLKSKEHGRAIPIAMLLVGAITLICGIVPFLALCFSMWFANGTGRLPGKVTSWLAPISCSCLCLVGLACWVMQLINSKRWTYGFLAIGMLCIVIYSVNYCRAQRKLETELPRVSNTTGENQTEGKLEVEEDSLEFLAGVTALLFLGLEGLALEGQVNGDQGAQHRLVWSMGVSFVSCVLGVFLMLVETIPPSRAKRDWQRYLTWLCDIPMAFAISLVMFLIMSTILKLQVALLLLFPPFLILLVHAFDIYRSGRSDGVEHVKPVEDVRPDVKPVENVKPASLELSKVTFTGFLAVSIPAISSGSLSMPTDWFLMSAAWAVVSGLVWRLLSHAKMEKIVIFSSFFTHLCIAVATVAITTMAIHALH